MLKSFSFIMILISLMPSFLFPAFAEENEGVVSAHYDNYLLPFYKESRVNQARFEPLNPNAEQVKSTFLQFQISIKYRLLSFEQHGIYLAYTQKSNWEAYEKSAYFRDSQYNPEIFYRWHTEDSDWGDWQVSIGSEHESNGAGGNLEVSWNRGYVEITRHLDYGYVRFKPWFRFGSISYNPDIDDYLGYGELEFAWIPIKGQKISLLIANLFASDIDRGYYNLNWNFPVYQGVRGYIKAETGYGVTISNYNFTLSAYGAGVVFDF